jgi:non-canonical poly(A) RNA polymerase PAPD5/7
MPPRKTRTSSGPRAVVRGSTKIEEVQPQQPVAVPAPDTATAADVDASAVKSDGGGAGGRDGVTEEQIASVNRTRRTGSIFSAMAAKKDDLLERIMPEAPDPDAVSCISPDLTERLKAHQVAMASPQSAGGPATGGRPSGLPPRSSAKAEATRDSSNADPDSVARRRDVLAEMATVADAASSDDADGTDDDDDDDETMGTAAPTDGTMDEDFYGFLPKAGALGAQDESAAVARVSAPVPGAAAKVVTLKSGKKKRRTPQFVRVVPLWARKRFEGAARGYSAQPVVALHQEVTDLVDYLMPTEAEIFMRRLAELGVADVARKLWPGCEPCAYGSMSTHLLLPTSDLDMSILAVPGHTEDALAALCRAISQERLCAATFPQMILKTKVPLLKFATRVGSVEVDVSVNAADGKANSELVKELLGQFPEARPLIIVAKCFLQQRDMHEPFRGGLGSFATTLLVLSFLQHHPIYTTACARRHCYGLGKLLVDFFRYYSQAFNFHRVGVSLGNDGEYFQRPPSNGNENMGRGPNQMLLQDPGNAGNNAASSLRNWQAISTAFESAYMMLTADWPATRDDVEHDAEVVHPQSPSVTHRPTLLSRIIHADSGVVAKRKANVAAYTEFVKTADPAVVARVAAYRRDEDRPLMEHTVTQRLDGKPSDYVPPVVPQQVPPSAYQQQAQQQQQRYDEGPSRVESTSYGGGGGGGRPPYNTGAARPPHQAWQPQQPHQQQAQNHPQQQRSQQQYGQQQYQQQNNNNNATRYPQQQQQAAPRRDWQPQQQQQQQQRGGNDRRRYRDDSDSGSEGGVAAWQKSASSRQRR